MESIQETMGSHSCESGYHFIHAGAGAAFSVVKGKRTKRQRLHLSPFAALSSRTAVDDSSSASSTGMAASPAGSITEEDEDMANCLILLAQGRTSAAGTKSEEGNFSEFVGATEKFASETTGEAAQAPPTEKNGKDGSFVYECKTCSKCFPSFQALGGHRASHKKPKLAAINPTRTASPAANDNKKFMINEDLLQISMNSFSKPAPVNSPSSSKQKTHYCSICGAEFSSGQALGGHMRRHRPLVVSNHNNEHQHKEERNLISLDLNLPAPSEDEPDGFRQPPSLAFSFNSSQRPLIFPASALSFGGLPLVNIEAN